MDEHKDYFDARLCFKGDEDKVASLLDFYAQNQVDITDVNQILQLYHTQLFFRKVDAVLGWDETKYNYYKGLSNTIGSAIAKFFKNITEDNVVEIYNCCHVSYWDDFREGIYKYKVYEHFSKERITGIIDGMHLSPEHVLENKGFVNYFDDEITKMIQDVSFGARFVISYYLEKKTSTKKYFIPKGLTKEMREKIVQNYIEDEHVNPRELQLIIEARNPELPISPKMKMLAKQRYDDFWKNNSGVSYEHGFCVSFGPYDKEFSCRREKNIFHFEYDDGWIGDNTDYPTLLNNFIYLFGYVNSQMICSFALRKAHRSVFEDLFSVKGVGMYERDTTFNMLDSLADAQMAGYVSQLSRNNIGIEEIIKWFFVEYLPQEFNVHGIACNVPMPTDSLISKCKTLPSAIDGVLSRFKMLCDDGEIDDSLFEYITDSPRIRDIPSLVKNKYGYPGENVMKETTLLFSDQTMLGYTEKTKSKYQSLFDLVLNEQISLEECEPYNIETLTWLIDRGVLCIENGIICANEERLLILKTFYENESISLQHMRSPMLRNLIKSGEVIVGSTLLTDSECHYFDYELNNADYSNGRALRNKYVHDSIVSDEKIMQADYFAMLKIMIILIIKINDDCCLKELVEKEGDFYEL